MFITNSYSVKIKQSNNSLLAKAAAVCLLTSLSINSIIPTAFAEEELVIGFKAPRQTNEVAFVPFAGDSLMSSVVINNLNSTELKVTSRDLPDNPHSSADLSKSLKVWQNLQIPYLVVGETRSTGGKIVIDFEVIDTSTGRVIKGKQTQTSNPDAQSLRYAAHVVSDKIYEIITGNLGDFSGRIAYIEEEGSGETKISSLKVMDADGQNTRSIYRVQGSIFSPVWSPDGRTLAYAVQFPKGLPVINIQNADKGSPQLVTPFRGNNLSPSFSPDGGSLLFSSSFEGNADIYKLRIGPNQPQKIISMPSSEVQPSYAPDGRSFVFVSDKLGENKPQIYRYTFGTKRIDRLSHSGYATSPSFSPDGSKIAFLNGTSAAIMNLRGEVTTNIGNTGIDEAPSFSPNGKRVVFASKKGGRGMITIRSLNGGNDINKATAGTVRSPVWSKKPTN